MEFLRYSEDDGPVSICFSLERWGDGFLEV